MKENVGRADQAFRLTVGPALFAFGFSRLGGSEGRLGGLAAMLSGAILTETGITRVCPMNAIFGIDTRNRSLKLHDVNSCLQPIQVH